MKIIKLRTTESTNSFLKELAKETLLKSFTVVLAKEQTLGRGQVAQEWSSEPFKNLTFSVFISFENLKTEEQKYLNFAVSLAVFKVLKELNLPSLFIKWPNDILSENKKLCGVLIENQLKKNKITSSVIGIGLNVNQTNFKYLPKATSIKNSLGKDLDLDVLLKEIIIKLKLNVELLFDKKYLELEKKYLENLYKYQKPSMFKNSENKLFMGKIVGVSSEGKLQIELEDETVREFGIKEVSFVK